MTSLPLGKFFTKHKPKPHPSFIIGTKGRLCFNGKNMFLLFPRNSLTTVAYSNPACSGHSFSFNMNQPAIWGKFNAFFKLAPVRILKLNFGMKNIRSV